MLFRSTVCSAYRMALAREEANQPSSSCTKENTIWRKIWKLNIPPKIKHFLWRALINSLPTKLNLKKRGVQVWEVCERCGAEKEDTNHILWLCPSARVVWESSPSWCLCCNSQHQNFEEVTKFILQLDQPELQELFAILA